MSTYLIRPNSRGFGIYLGRNWIGRPKLLQQHDRLFNAELATLHLVTQDYHKLLDYRRLTNQVMSTDMMEPRTSEEHVYTALLLAGKRPPGGDGSYDDISGFSPRHAAKDPADYHKYDNILEHHLGSPISHVARVMFEERFMTWYGRHHPEWTDPRRERDYDIAAQQLGGNRYRTSEAAMSAGYGSPNPGTVKKWLASLKFRKDALWQALFGPTAKQMQQAAEAMNQSAASGR